MQGFEDFVDGHWAPLVRFAYVLSHDAGRAEDLVQEALVQLSRRWDATDQAAVEFPDAYVRRCIVTGYLSWRRRRASTEIVGLDGFRAEQLETPDSVVERDALWRLLHRLPRRQRAVLVLRYYVDLGDAEIASMLGCTPATVRSLAARGLTAIRNDIVRPALTSPDGS